MDAEVNNDGQLLHNALCSSCIRHLSIESTLMYIVDGKRS